MMCRAVNERLYQSGHTVVSVVNGHCPQIDKHKENEIHYFVQREDERIDVVREALQKTIDWVKSVACKRGGYLPLVMWFVDVPIEPANVQPSMYPVN